MSNPKYAADARKALEAGDRARFLRIRYAEANAELNLYRVPNFVGTGEFVRCPLSGQMVERRTNANIPLRNRACRRANRLFAAEVRAAGRLVRLVDRCDSFWQVELVHNGELAPGLPGNCRFTTRAAAADAAWLRGYSVEGGR